MQCKYISGNQVSELDDKTLAWIRAESNERVIEIRNFAIEIYRIRKWKFRLPLLG